MKSFNSFVTEQNINESLIDLLIKEELTPDEMKTATKWAANNTISHKIDKIHDAVFGGKDVDRVTIPLETGPKNYTGHPLHDHIKAHIEPHGYKIQDYAKNLATDKHGRETSVTKALGKTKGEHLTQPFNNDPVRQSTHANAGGKMVTISRHPIDVAGMTSGRKWENSSCMNLSSGCNRKFIKSDMTHGTLAAYVHDAHDTNLQNPHGRILLKRHDDIEGGHYSGHTIFRPEQRTYGTGGKEFENTVNNWAEKHYPEEPGKMYAKHQDLYNDDGKTFSGKVLSFKPKIMDHLIKRAVDAHENQHNDGKDHFGDEWQPKRDYVQGALHSYREKLKEPEQKKMDLHLHTQLTNDFHDPEVHHYNHNKAYSSEPDGYDDDETDHAIHRFTHETVPIHKEHVDQLAKNYHETWGKHFAQDEQPQDDHHTDLEHMILKHGSDETKADYLHHTRLYGHEEAADSPFHGDKHITGPHSAKAYYETHAQPYEEHEHNDVNHSPETHANMAKHADNETFHNWLHSPAVTHDAKTYSAMSEVASKERQHKMADDLHFDNSEHNGHVDHKRRGIAMGSQSKSVLKRIINNKGADMDSRRTAVDSMRTGKDQGTLTESLLTRIQKLV